MKKAVRAPKAPRPISPAPPNIPSPLPACWPFCATSAFARSSSCLTSVVVSSESCFSRSPIGRSRRSFPLWLSSTAMTSGLAEAAAHPCRRSGGGAADVAVGPHAVPGGVALLGCGVRGAVARGGSRRPRGRDLRRRRVVARAPLLVALTARRLHEAGRRESEREPAGHDRPRLPACEVLDVVQDAVGIRLGQVAPEPLRAVRGLLGELRGRVLALLAQLLADTAEVACRGRDLLAGLCGALVDLLAHAALRLAGRLLRFLLGLVCDLRHDFLLWTLRLNTSRARGRGWVTRSVPQMAGIAALGEIQARTDNCGRRSAHGRARSSCPASEISVSSAAGAP